MTLPLQVVDSELLRSLEAWRATLDAAPSVPEAPGHGSEVYTEDDTWRCKLANARLIDRNTGEIRGVDCGSWSCVEHGSKKAWRWRERVHRAEWRLMLTLSLVPEDRGEARVAWAKLARWLRRSKVKPLGRKGGPSRVVRGMTTYLRVLELGSERGMRHWHVLTTCEYIDVYELSEYAVQSGLGEVVWVSVVNSVDGATYYLLGYVMKSLGVKDERTQGWRKVTVSRDIPAWPEHLARRFPWNPESDTGAQWELVGSTDAPRRPTLHGGQLIEALKGGKVGEFQS